MCYGRPVPDCLPVRQEAAHRGESPLMEGGREKDNLMIGWGEVSSSYDPLGRPSHLIARTEAAIQVVMEGKHLANFKRS